MSNKVTIRRQGVLIEATPADKVMPLIRGEFEFRRLVEKTDGYGRRIGHMLGDLECLYQEESGNRVVISAGLTQRLKKKLTRAGIPYEYKDLRSKKWPKPQFNNVFDGGYELRPGQDELLAKLATYDMGRIDNPTGDGKSQIICFMVMCFPRSSFLIVTDGLAAFGDLYDRLIKITPDVGRVGGGNVDVERVTLCNKDSLHRVPGPDYDFCMVDECHVMAAPKTAPKFSGITNARIFAFSATQHGRHDQSDILLEAMFGPVIHEVPYQLSQQRGNISQIEVTMYECPFGPNLDRYNSQTARKRHGYWRNDGRNRLLAYVAKEIVPAADQQLIIVDTIEHALRIKQYLPGWTVVYSPKGKDKMDGFVLQGLIDENELLKPKDVDKLRVDFKEGKILRAIANSVWHKAVDFKQLEYLIRADGGRGSIGSIQIGGRLSRLHGDNVKHLVDFVDVFDRVSLDRSTARERVYASKGWKIIKSRIEVPEEWGIHAGSM